MTELYLNSGLFASRAQLQSCTILSQDGYSQMKTLRPIDGKELPWLIHRGPDDSGKEFGLLHILPLLPGPTLSLLTCSAL